MSRHPWRNLKNPRGNPEDFFYALSLRGAAEAIQEVNAG